jgi:hypothetical protein
MKKRVMPLQLDDIYKQWLDDLDKEFKLKYV